MLEEQMYGNTGPYGIFNFDQTALTPTQSILSSETYAAFYPSVVPDKTSLLKRPMFSITPSFCNDMTNYEPIPSSPDIKRIRVTDPSWDARERPIISPHDLRCLENVCNEDLKKVIRESLESATYVEVLKDDKDPARTEQIRKQRLYNGHLIDAHNQQQEIEFQLVLESNPLIDVSLQLVIHMKPHQIEGVQFLWNQVFKSRGHLVDGGGSGAILAHCMGLGKTFTTIVLLHTLFRCSSLTHIKRVLILCQLNTAINWKNEFHQWLSDLLPVIPVYLFSSDDIRIEGREQFLQKWYENGGVLLMGYEMYRQLTYTVEDNPYDAFRKSVKKMKKEPSLTELANIEKYRRYLRNPGPDLIVCDEGHMIKNPKSGIACTLNQIRTRRRIVLTGTPMQNNLKEYYSMVDFCRPNFLGTRSEFSDRYRRPIEKGQHRDSSKAQVDYMRRRIFALRQRLQPLIHRKDFEVLRSFLPPKFEYAIKIRCRPLQRKLYETYIQYQNINGVSRKLDVTKLFADYQYLMKIWTHPWLLQPYFIEHYNKSLEENNRSEIDQMIRNEFDVDTEKNRDVLSTDNLSVSNVHADYDVWSAMKEQWWFPFFDPTDSQFDFTLSGKMVIFKAILDECHSVGDKLLVFTRSLMTLDYIEQCLAYWSQQSSKLMWQKGVDYFRMDGTVPVKRRAADMQLFNDANNLRSRLFLISTLAGGLGVNLFTANRVIILDTSWNPAHDLQAMFRSYRLGQTKPVYIYRLIVKGTMEEKIYKRQITKQAMFHRVVDAKQLARHFTYDELAQLYQSDFDVEDDPVDQSGMNTIQDQLLWYLLKHHAETIVSYREHDSFLIHNDQENLTVEEQQQATDEADNRAERFSRRRLQQHSSEFMKDIFSLNSEANEIQDGIRSLFDSI